MNDQISVIVTIYNVKPYLQKCLDSIVAQTYQNLEIILVDDGSTDGSSDICDQYAKRDSRIIVVHKENEGLVRARKTGIKMANGKYVGYVDADDWIEPNMYQKLYEGLCASGADVVSSGRIEEFPQKSIIAKNKIKAGVYKGEDLKALYSKMIFTGKFYEFGIYPTVWDKLFKRELLEKNQLQVPDDIRIGEDVACVYPYLLDAKVVCILDEVFYHYRQRQGSMLTIEEETYNEKIFMLYQYLYDRTRHTKYLEILKPQIDIYTVDMVLNSVRKMYGLNFAISEPVSKSYFLFPFHKVKKDSSIVLYGAGAVGKIYQQQIEHSGYCKVVSWVDKNAKNMNGFTYGLHSPEELNGLDYDQIIICVKSEVIAEEIRKELEGMGIDQNKIVWENPVY